jgi:RNA polymerase sigma-70 factor (ECF subfamily)
LILLDKETALAPNDPGAAPTPDPGSFAAVVNEHWTAVYRLLYSMTGNTHDTEDLTQETFLRALKRFDTFRPGTRMRAWLLRIASNAFFDVQRQRGRIRIKSLDQDVPTAGQRPEHALESAEQHALLQAALTGLSNTDRMVFHLRVQEELSHREIAEILEISEEAARWHLHQARVKLMKRLAGKV